MIKQISRRNMLKGTAAAVALGAASRTFGAPARIAAQGSDIEIKYWTSFGSGTNGEAQTKIVDDFNAQGNGVKVVTTSYSSYEEIANAILTGLDSGDVPHVGILSDVWWFSFYLRGALKDLTDLVVSPDDYVQSLYADYTRNGQWCVPFARSTPLFYYNVDALDKAGLDASIFETWTDFRNAGPDLVKAAGLQGAFAFGNAASYGAWTMHGPVWAFGGNYSKDFDITITEDPAIEVGEFMREFVTDFGGIAVADPGSELIAGTIAASINSTGSLGTITEAAQIEFKTLELPSEMQFGCPTGGSGLGILASASDEETEAAAKFLDFSTNTENAAYWAETSGYMPVRTSGIESDRFQKFLADNPNNKVAIEQLPKTTPQDAARVFIPNGDQTIGKAWEQILVNNMAAADAFAEAKATLEEDAKPVLEALSQIEG